MDISEIQALIDSDNTDSFYDRAVWKRLSLAVKRMDNYECQHHKAKGKYKRGDIVHHVKHLKDRPDLALSIYDPRTKQRQLVTLCRACHELEHPEHMIRYKPKAEPLTEERWD